MKTIKNILFGVAYGAAGLLPGSSSGTIAVVFNFLHKLVRSISNIFKDFTNSILFLLPFAIGMAGGMYGLALGLTELSAKYSNIVSCAFTGIILGSMPLIFSKATVTKKKIHYVDIIAAIAAFALIIILTSFTGIHSGEYVTDKTFHLGTAITMFAYGTLSGIGPIIPGVSGSMLLITFGGMNTYRTAIEALSTMNFAILIPFGLGTLASIFIFVRIFNVLFKRHQKITYFIILGFLFASVITVFPGVKANLEGVLSVVLMIICGGLFYFVSQREIRRTIENKPVFGQLSSEVENEQQFRVLRYKFLI